MKRKLLSTVVALSMTASMTMPVFAAAQNNQTSEVPVVGKVGRWEAGNTDPTNPSKPGSGGEGEHGEVKPPANLTDINVTVPTSMTFNVVTNTTDTEPAFATAEYTITNNGAKPVNMTGEYKVKEAGDITLVDTSAVSATANGAIQLGLSLNSGDANAVNTPFIENVKDGATSGQALEIANAGSKCLKFDSTAKGMSDVKAEAKAGNLKDTKTTTGNLVLTFQQQ
ncbi:hypothetical protein GNF80_17640 [Clostridium perfringens]|nr:hypothetical protein [Clostridium perfringens]